MREGFVKKENKKVCKCCGEKKDIKEFYINGNYKDGHLNICKECHAEKIRQNKIERKGKAIIKVVVPVEIKYEIDKRQIDLEKVLVNLVK